MLLRWTISVEKHTLNYCIIHVIINHKNDLENTAGFVTVSIKLPRHNRFYKLKNLPIETLNYHTKLLLNEDGFYDFCEQQIFLFHLSDLFLITLSADVSVTR